MQKIKYVSRETIHRIDTSTYLIWVYMDLAEKELINLVQLTHENDLDKQMVKYKLEQMKKLALDFRQQLNNKLRDKPDKIEQFGEVSDHYEVKIKTDLYQAMKEELGL